MGIRIYKLYLSRRSSADVEKISYKNFEKLWKIKPKSGEFANFTGRIFVKKQFFFKGSKNRQGVQLSGFRPRQRIRDVRPVLFENVKKVDWGCGWAVKLRQSRVKKGDFGGFFHIFAFFHD